MLCVCMCVRLLLSCPVLFDPMDCSLPGSSAHGILQARILEWVAISSPIFYIYEVELEAYHISGNSFRE